MGAFADSDAVAAPSSLRLTRRGLAFVLAALPVTAAAGPYLLPVTFGGVNLYAFRLLVAVTFPVLLLLVAGRLPLTKPASRFLVILCVWIAWGCASLLWTPDARAGATEILTLCFGTAAVAVVVLAFVICPQGMDALRRGWVLAYLASGAVAVWELHTHQHLQSSFSANAPDYAQGVLVSTFGNPNNYAAFIVMAFPFLLWSTAQARGVKRLLTGSLCITAPLALVLTAGRLGLIALLLQLAALTMLQLQGRNRGYLRIIPIVTALAVVIAVSLRAAPATLEKLARVGAELRHGGSSSIRLNLLLNGLQFAIDSRGFGAGAGSFEHMIQAGHGPLPTMGFINPHNFWIEILAQYGFVIFALVIGWYAYACIAVIRRLALSRSMTPDFRWALIATALALVGYAFAAIENSRFIPDPSNWACLASMVALVGYVSKLSSTKTPQTPP